ncbi:hypothetical protein BofuT4_uP054990.1 [Botrytis cinerea T4]|uniref:Uncharacterized protein n=1 Tax=Botryotinia fuckeliana (strain T4) TaxID=999810 RepID=G2XVS8_BOTF4|nr:hypothetical protein BofuT4_uP054990.1 [Botrytis cinerea T4]
MWSLCVPVIIVARTMFASGQEWQQNSSHARPYGKISSLFIVNMYDSRNL